MHDVSSLRSLKKHSRLSSIIDSKFEVKSQCLIEPVVTLTWFIVRVQHYVDFEAVWGSAAPSTDPFMQLHHL